MGFCMPYYSTAFVVGLLLITHEAIFPVNGQCTIQSCDNRDQLVSIVAEIHQLRVDLFDQLNKQVQSTNVLNASIQEMKSHHATVMTRLQEVDRRRSKEHDIYIKQGQSIHEIINTSFLDMKSQHDSINMSPLVQDVCIKQRRSIHKLLNKSVQDVKSQLDALNKSFQTVDRCPLERGICREQRQSMQDAFKESFEEMKSQHATIVTSLQAVDRRLEKHDISIKDQTRNLFEGLEICIRDQTQHSLASANDMCRSTSRVCDCSNLKASGLNTSGVYVVCVRHQARPVCSDAFCDMETTNGGSLVFQRRKDGSVNFNRTWAEYSDGFGNPDGEFWLGNEMLHLLTSKRNYKLRVDLEDWEGAKRYAEYANFSISSLADKYRLTVRGYSGNAGDSMTWDDRRQFSTFDAHNDEYQGHNCAVKNGGAWWYHYCSYAFLNGKYHQRYDTVQLKMGITWNHWKNSWNDSLKATEMKLVPVA